MAEFAMLSSMTGSPRYLFSIQGVSKSQTAGYIFCKLSNVVVRCAPIVNECLCISQNYLFATRFVRWVREGLSALQVWTLVWGLPGPGRDLVWGHEEQNSQGGIWNLESFLCCTSLTLILTWSKLYYSVLSGVELVLGLRWTGTLNTKNYTTRSTGDLLVLIWSFIKYFKKKNTDSQQWRRIAALVCNGSGQSWCKIFHFWTRQPMSHMDHKEIVFIFPPSGKPPSTKKWLYLAIFAPISLL